VLPLRTNLCTIPVENERNAGDVTQLQDTQARQPPRPDGMSENRRDAGDLVGRLMTQRRQGQPTVRTSQCRAACDGLPESSRGRPRGGRRLEPSRFTRSSRMPSGSYSGAASHRLTYSTTHGRSVYASTALMIRSHPTQSKNFWTSRLITQSFFQKRFRHAATAPSAPPPSRYR